MVDIDRAMEMIESIRASLPQEVQEARQIVAERESVLAQAHAEAERLVDAAQREAAERVRQEGVYKTAERQARAILDQASARAAEERARADEYAIESLRSLETHLRSLEERLAQTLDTVHNGIATLQARTYQQAPPEEEAHPQAP
jgi:cell division septum initiation protein DivIVA